MIFLLKFTLIPLISATIGWVTNKIAVWLLFNPVEPIYVFRIKFQGVFPKRQSIIADRIGNLVADELLSTESIKNQIFEDKNISAIINYITDKVDQYLEHDFKEEHWFINLFVGNDAKAKFKAKLEDKLNDSLIDLSNNFHYYLEDKVNIRKLVSNKIQELDSGEVNNLMNQILKSELRFIELSGAILGFIIGLLQVCLLEFIG